MGTSRRFKKRYAQHPLNVIKRFEALSSADHIRNAVGVIQRVRSDGGKYFGKDSKRLEQWEQYCTKLWDFLMCNLSKRRYGNKKDLAAALRKYIQEFEHVSHRLHQMLYGVAYDHKSASLELTCWLELAYRHSTYGILAD